jgi:hypothetical protein
MSRAQRWPRRRFGILAGLLAVAAIAIASVAVVLGSQHRTSSPPKTLGSIPTPGDQSVLHSVACASPTSCVAVGWFSPRGSGDIERSLVEVWNGAAWSLVSSHSPASDTELQSIACPSRRACVAVGFSGPAGSPSARHAFAEVWDGSSWQVAPVPSAGTPSAFQAVACASANSCTAVGSSSTATDGFASALLESWDGSAWSLVSTRPPPTSYVSGLNSVTCVAATSCIAVGSYSNNSTSDDPDARTLVESWNGSTWSVVPSPNPGNGYHSVLLSIACASPSACVAAGDYSARGDFYKADDQSLVEVWSGSAWSVVDSAGLGAAGQSLFNSVACTAPTQCVAVGFTSRGADQDAQSLAERWDGTSWSVVPNPVMNGVFESVACAVPTSCVAVGEHTTAGSPLGLALAQWLAR